MGMDVYGNAPTTKEGEYFRKNVWGWHPLWNLCEHLSPDIAGSVKYGHSNDGDGLGQRDAGMLGRLLWDALWDGRVDAFINSDEKSRERTYAKPPFFGDAPDHYYATDRESVQNFALFLRDCGGFEIC
jgi:hypothetical protein